MSFQLLQVDTSIPVFVNSVINNSDNDLLPDLCRAIILANVDLLSIEPYDTYCKLE